MALPEEFVQQFLSLIAEAFEWPNAFLVPDDPCWLVLLPDCDESLAPLL